MGDNGKQVSWLAAYGPNITFPDPERPVVFDARHTAYSCGGSPGFSPEFPLNPREGNLSYLLTVPQNDGRVNRMPTASGPRRRVIGSAEIRPVVLMHQRFYVETLCPLRHLEHRPRIEFAHTPEAQYGHRPAALRHAQQPA